MNSALPHSPLRRSLLAGALAMALGGLARAQPAAYPARALNWVVGFPAGGGTDALARTVGAGLGERLKQSVVIDNRPGAAGILAADRVSHEAPDGYTLLTGDIAILVFNPAIYPNVRYDPLNDFTPVALMAQFPLIIATHPGSGLRSMADVVQLARAHPEQALYGSAGVGTPHHLAMEMLQNEAGIKAEHVPYKGDMPALQDLAGGQIPLAILAPAVSLPYFKSGKLVPLAVTSDERLAQLPDVPSLKELSLAKAGVYAWQGLVGPRGMPPAVVGKLSANVADVLKDPAVVAKLAELGMQPSPADAQGMADHIRSEQQRWVPLIKARGIRSN
ncbi:Bug family tripartite tricarboxylate transporter substrate binding protein [Achromobacter deleyi]|uniref:Bug family tripartite tricarboxylate transporter substrate binding protein n=1 Tax=Achromobacter deleyi TaxID=1353891 RepID=UPI001491AD6E|nr:tripartite tricarboxylate transporter substrate binding protein [Achromobacter deleyi]QVQ27017.1 tripartite tricarboxylate transporter substrate binding protein [Achromobacter deleyi]UIP22597.1 tripartite tricarboxylate transporter substrate binding protein [Achromobacter deleyi]